MANSFQEYLRMLQAGGVNPRYYEVAEQDLGFSIPALKEAYQSLGIGTSSDYARGWYQAVQNVTPQMIASYYLPRLEAPTDPAVLAKMAEDWAVSAATYGRRGNFPIPLTVNEAAQMLQFGLSPQTAAGLNLAFLMQDTEKGGGLDKAYGEYSAIATAVTLFTGNAVSPVIASRVSQMLLDAWDGYRKAYLDGQLSNMSFTEYLAKTTADALKFIFPGFDLHQVVRLLETVPAQDLSKALSPSSPPAGNKAPTPQNAPSFYQGQGQAPNQTLPGSPSQTGPGSSNQAPLGSSNQASPGSSSQAGLQGQKGPAQPSTPLSFSPSRVPSVSNPYSLTDLDKAVLPVDILFSAQQYGTWNPVPRKSGSSYVLGGNEVQYGGEALYQDTSGQVVYADGFVLTGPFLDYWAAGGGWLGRPRTHPFVVPNGGVLQVFDRAALLYRDGSVIPVDHATVRELLGKDAIVLERNQVLLMPGTEEGPMWLMP